MPFSDAIINKILNIMEDIYLKIRSRVLYCALQTEDSINTLVLLYLSIPNKNNTKNFGSKGVGMSFKNKIDLLFDINVLAKEEHLALDLLMSISNKILHDIEYTTYEKTIMSFDSGIRNRFIKFIEQPKTNYNEDDYEEGFSNLYLHNAKLILQKIKNRRLEFEEEGRLIEGNLTLYQDVLHESYSFVDKIYATLEECDLDEKDFLKLSEVILKVTNAHVVKLKENFNQYIEFNKDFTERIITLKRFNINE